MTALGRYHRKWAEKRGGFLHLLQPRRQQRHRYRKPTANSPKYHDENSDEMRRDAYRAHSERGEEQLVAKQYAMAIASFNEAKQALLTISSVAKGTRQREGTRGVTLATMRDELNLACLLERITDCHVEQLFHCGSRYEYDLDSDLSHVSYVRAVTALVDVRWAIAMELKGRETIEADEESRTVTTNSDKRGGWDELENLSREVTKSLARIQSKRGRVQAGLGLHHEAVGSFGRAITTWEESSGCGDETRESIPSLDIDDPLLVETENTIANKEIDPKITFDANSLVCVNHVESLDAALQMAKSHYSLGDAAGRDDHGGPALAIHHHLLSLKLASEIQRLRSSFDFMTTGRRKSKTWRASFLGVASGVSSKEGRSCALLKTQQQICIAHASFCLGFWSLSEKWLLQATAGMDELRITDAKELTRDVMSILSVLVLHEETQRQLERGEKLALNELHSLYQSGMNATSARCDDDPRMIFHVAMSAFQNGLVTDALNLLSRAPKYQVCKTYDEVVLHTIDAQVIIEVRHGNIDKALVAMNRRMDVVSRWIGNPSVELAKDLHRVGCLESILGNHKESGRSVMNALNIGQDYDGFDTLDSLKLLASTFDALNRKNHALSGYKSVLAKEKMLLDKARLMNAIAHLHMNEFGLSDVASSYIDESLRIQRDFANADHDDIELSLQTMLLHGNSLASKKSYFQAISLYQSVLDSNPIKDPVNQINLRASYNKGVALFQSGDIPGASLAFKVILDEVENNSAVTCETAFVVNAIGNICFLEEDYDGAIKRYRTSLSLDNAGLSLSQRVGTLCNIALAYHKKRDYGESEAVFNEAIEASEHGVGISPSIEAAILSRLAQILYKCKRYLFAYKMFTKAASVAINSDGNSGLSDMCKGCAETCLRVIAQKRSRDFPERGCNVVAIKPRIDESLAPLADSSNLYSEAVYSPKKKILSSMGVEALDSCMITLPLDDGTEILCDEALGCLLKRSEDCRVKHALKFIGLLAETVNSKLLTIKPLFDN